MFPIPQQTLSREQRQLLDLFRRIGEADRASLLAFAEFLAARAGSVQPESPGVAQEPRELPRPAEESVVAAIRRLSHTYHMVDRQEMLSETASLMTAHVMHGRSAPDVIDELETAFRNHYERYLESFGK